MADSLHPPVREGAVTLPDGRSLGFAEYGDRDGPVAIYCHGFPSCRLEPALVPLSGIRLVAPDRPGLGLSDPCPGRRLADWPDDIAALADRLGIGRFSVVGLSGGVPYATACAARLGARIEAAALVNGLAPAGLGWEGRSWAGRMMALGRRPNLARPVAQALRGALLKGPAGAAAAVTMTVLGMPGPDREALPPESATALLGAARTALAPGIEGVVADMAIYAADWELDLDAITAPVQVWHGLADTLVPPAAAKVLAARIPGARLHLVEGEGHFSLVIRRHREILRALLDEIE
ncbi:alpha/beta fold hydrolase [Arenibaculum pallidiluteum]|uniref:alpha/beta fold hydrolase n=1 Tax=Arenibaculum pallidiluteum TaxID=2812559 RepID=UPI001A956F11|nr:alpha/beta hydrolase [Arenibaculum pallidiluteum]